MKKLILTLMLIVGMVVTCEAKNTIKYVGLAEISLDGTFRSPIVEVIDIEDYTKREYDDGTCLVTTEAFAKNLYKSLSNNPDFAKEYPNFKVRVKCRKEVK